MKVQIARFSTITILALSSLLLGACGGGGGGGGGVSPPPPPVSPPPPPTGGITRTGIGVAAGPITGFGSVIVNGVRYDTSSATFIRDDSNSDETEFEVGETVIVTGTIDDDNTNAVAVTVELEEIVEGPVTAVADNPAGGSQLTVMGQTVNVGATALIDDSCNVATVGDLVTSVFAVEVYGSVDGSGVIDATRIECKTAAEVTEFEVNGIVSGLDTGATTFMINGLQVNYGSASQIDDFPTSGVINNGDPVEAKGPPANFVDGTPPVLTASKVEYKGNILGGDEGDHLEVDGFITNFVSATSFDLRTGTTVISVTTTSTTVYEGGTEADLANNLKIEVEGEINGDGDLQATKIEIKDSTNIRVTGLVDADPVAGVITILGITVNTDPIKTRFDDKTGVEDPFLVGQIGIGDYVEVRGQEQPPGQITAFRVERDDPDPDTELRGFVEDDSVSGRDSFRILGVTVLTAGVTAGNYFRSTGESGVDEPITADEFWAGVGTGGVIVDVNGTETGTTELTARELTLELE
jgi:hypothetical protein